MNERSVEESTYPNSFSRCQPDLQELFMAVNGHVWNGGRTVHCQPNRALVCGIKGKRGKVARCGGGMG